ncbi:WD repeat-containing protein [Colletotrichum sojae]|uniref:WD repeat-containing protein n=1 Tax=Colletotrichum sojae TaxID=2175907 RepID=A0A8H6MMG9_9PEZI|nr:WD repeat-containing protein [Colletotrichum sojae]
MTPVYADHPYALIPSPAFQDSKDEKGPPDMFCRVASEMAMVHNMAIRGLNSIYLQAPHVSAADSKYFVQYMLAWHALLHVHHSGEEAHFFPAVEAMTGEEGIMEANVAQHKEFHEGLDGFKAYADACASGKEKLDGGKVVGLIDGFGEVLTKHLREEIASLLELRKFGTEQMAELEEKFGEDGEKSMKELGLVKGLPFCFANHDVGYEDGRWASWPPAPSIVKLICRHVTYHLHAKCWRFAACDRMGKLRPFLSPLSQGLSDLDLNRKGKSSSNSNLELHSHNSTAPSTVASPSLNRSRHPTAMSMAPRENKIMRKLLGKVTADSSTDTNHTIGITSAPHFSSYRPSASQNAVYAVGAPILCLDTSPDRRNAIIAGRHVLKTIVLDGLSVAEGTDVRAAITAQSASSKGASSSLTADQLSIRDVKWHNDATVFTACANGKIFSYDISRVATGGAALEFVHTREDSRQVNSLDINPHRQTTLLSGSQDGMVRYFDIRAPIQSRSGGLTYSPRGAYKCNADGVRQVKWSPKDGFYFACGTESGVVLKWDVRKIAQPLLKIPAHDKACASISWHPDGNHLISGGVDSKCAVWDMSKNADKRQKPRWVVYTPAPVAAVAWRPGLWSASAQGKRAAQVAVSYDDGSQRRYGINSVHIWDLARPSMPYKEIDRFESSPSGMLWQDQDLLWTVGNDGLFNQCDVAFAPKVLDRQSMSSMALSARGDAVMFLDERPHHRPRPPVISHHHQSSIAPPRTSYSSSPTTPMLSISRSDSEEDVIGSFLGPRRRTGRKRRPSLRSVPVLSTTPPSGGHVLSDDQVLGLEQAIKVTGTYKTQQTMAVGHVPAAARVDIYQFLSSYYLETLERELPYEEGGKPLVKRVTSIMEQYARAAEQVDQFRLAQTWRILAYSMTLLLNRRAQFHLETRLGRFQKRPSISKIKDIPKVKVPRPLDVVVEMNGEETPRRPSALSNSVDSRSLGVRSLLSEEIESTSNVATPVARAINEENAEQGHRSRQLPPVMEPDDFALPPAAHSTFNNSPRRRLDSVPLSVTSHQSDQTQISSTDGYDFYDTDALQAVDVPEPRKREQKPLDYGPGTPNSRRTVRHNSDDSFAQMFSMSESSRQQSGLTSSSDGGAPARPVTSYPVQLQKPQLEEQGEYESRIRGKELEDSPEHGSLASLHGPGQSVPKDSPEDVFMISQTTMASDTATDEPSQSHVDSLPPTFEDKSPFHAGTPTSNPPKISPALQYDSTPTVLESDYLPWPEDPPYPHPLASNPTPSSSPPLNPYALLARALDFETRTSALNASAMILLLKPLMPEAVINPFRATAILRQHHARLTGMKLFTEAALLRKLSVRGWPSNVPDWGENYTSIFGPAQQGVKGGFLCPSCRKPRDLDPALGGKALWKCERCRAAMAPCAVCNHRDTADNVGSEEGGVMSVWWYCPGCAHGGHASCLAEWHAPSDGTYQVSEGCCPLDGCGHACLPGKWRDEKAAQRAEDVSRAAVEKAQQHLSGSSKPQSPVIPPRGVHSDIAEVAQSRAVESVRGELVSNSGSGGNGPTAGILSSSPGSRGGERERERRKSVKFVPTER